MANTLSGARAAEKTRGEARRRAKWQPNEPHRTIWRWRTAPVCCWPRRPLKAHHAFAAEFDANRPIKLRGTVTELDWINPHSWIHIDVKGADGKPSNWMIEGGSPNALLRLGLTKDALPMGSEVVVEGFQAKDGSNRGVGNPSRSRTAGNCFWVDLRRARTGTRKSSSRYLSRSLLPQTAPRLIHSVRMAISFGGSLGPGGIWSSPSCRRATPASHSLPACRARSRDRGCRPSAGYRGRGTKCSPFFSCSLWQPRQRLVRIGATRLSKNAGRDACSAARPAPRAPPVDSAPQKSQRAIHLRFHADAELIARANHLAVRDRHVQQLFALHLPPGLVL